MRPPADGAALAKVAELVYALVLGASGETLGGSSPPFRTNGKRPPVERKGRVGEPRAAD